jgi:hypothetical protein
MGFSAEMIFIRLRVIPTNCVSSPVIIIEQNSEFSLKIVVYVHTILLLFVSRQNINLVAI